MSAQGEAPGHDGGPDPRTDYFDILILSTVRNIGWGIRLSSQGEELEREGDPNPRTTISYRDSIVSLSFFNKSAGTYGFWTKYFPP